MKKTIGIIGGMGPMATVDLFRRIVENEVAAKDQDHVRVLIDNNTNIPDRTAALIAGGADPLPELIKSAQTLAAAGADFLIMPCNTAHGFVQKLAEASPVPILNMIQNAHDVLAAKGIRKVGLLATSGTIEAGIYPSYFGDIEVLIPDEADEKEVMSLIYDGVKAGNADFDASGVQAAAERLLERGAETIILGCTELPLAREMYDLEFPYCDVTLELANAAIRYAGGEVR